MTSPGQAIQLDLIRLYHEGEQDRSLTRDLKQASDLSRYLVSADFKSVLTSPFAEALFANRSKQVGIQDLLASLDTPSSSPPETQDTQDGLTCSQEEDRLCRLIVAIACLHAFVQINWTGPKLDFEPRDVLVPRSRGQDKEAHDALDSAMQHSAISLLSLDGEPAYHLAQHPALLLTSIRMLEQLEQEEQDADELFTLPWWTLRAGMVHRALLDEPVSFPETLLPRLEAMLVPENNTVYQVTHQDDRARLNTELGLAHHLLGMDRQASERFLAAARESGLEWALTGALGKRTKFQVKELSQLVLVTRSRDREHQDARDGKDQLSGTTSETLPQVDQEGKTANLKLQGMPETLALNDDTLLEQTQFTSSSLSYNGSTTEDLAPIKASSALPERLRDLNPQDQPSLDPLDQALLIDMCLAQHNNTPENGLTASQMAPFLARVLEHPNNWSVHTTALLLRARLESKRSRTIERSALQLQALIDQMPTADSKVEDRLRYFHQLPLLSKWEMERELALRFLGMGVVKTALEIFERLEMWEEAVKCYYSMEDTDKAVQTVRDLLEGRKAESDIVQKREKVERSTDVQGRKEIKRIKIDSTREGKLWCLLGDLIPEQAEEYYTKAWEVSNGTSSRSQRSLGGLYLAREEFTKAIPRFQAALKINPLYARTWFSLGCCLMREERLEEAREAFSRNVSVEEDDAEAWNNLAAVYLRLTREVGAVKAEDGEVSL